MSPTIRSMRASAVTYAALYLAAIFLPRFPEGAYSDERVTVLLGEGSDRMLIVGGGILLSLAGVALIPFLAGLAVLLRSRSPDTLAATAAPMGGLLHVCMLLIAATSLSGYATGLAIGEIPAPVETTLARTLSNQGFHALLIPGLLSAGVMILATTIAGRSFLPRWVWIAGLVVSPLTLLGVAWMPQFVVPIWCLLLSFTVLPQPQAQFETSRSSSHREPGLV
jgi:hypothetical protein